MCVVASPAAAFEAFNGRVQAHGFFESQLRTLSADYSEDWDVAQWYQVFNLELEFDLLPDGGGPFDLLSGFIRAEVRYDCVYSSGCGMFRSINAYGDRSKSLPRRLSNARTRTDYGTIERSTNASGSVTNFERLSGGTTDPVPLDRVSGFRGLATNSLGIDQARGNPTGNADCEDDFASAPAGLEGVTCASLVGGDVGPQPRVLASDGTVAKNDDPFTYVFENFEDFRFTQIQGRGGASAGLPTRVLGPWLPKNFVEANATLADRINPFDRSTRSPTLAASIYNATFDARFSNKFTPLKGFDRNDPADVALARFRSQNGAVRVSRRARGGGANPMRPIPIEDAARAGEGDDVARGLYYPTASLQRENDDFDNPNFNFREAERAWNRGASQQDEKELKEAYFDAELFDSRLWLRLGKQSIVWGKTELFRTTDQFNPQDLALASLPSLEESRISLWAARGVWSFYEVGPLEDVRLEIAFNFDQFEPADLGACGEAYTVNLVCELTAGIFAHGVAGIGIAGFDRPDDPWEDWDGWEGGVRLEWRYDRFSFALTNFYGYSDVPTLNRISTFERNVDPTTGRPRKLDQRGGCNGSPTSPGNPIDADCLKFGPTLREAIAKPNAEDTLFNAGRIVNLGLDTDGDGRPDSASKAQVLVDARCRALLEEVGSKKDPTFAANCFGPNKARIEKDRNALTFHSANQQLFALACSTTIGFLSLDPASCATTVFGSTTPIAGLGISQLISGVLAGSESANDAFAGVVNFGVRMPLVTLTQGEADADGNETGNDQMEYSNGRTNCRASFDFYGQGGTVAPEADRPRCGGNSQAEILSLPGAQPFSYNLLAVQNQALNQRLTPYQEALLGCGPFYGTNCDDDGIDLLNMEGSAILQSFVGTEGTLTGWVTDGRLDNFSDANLGRLSARSQLVPGDDGELIARQPGTVAFDQGALCTAATLFGDRSAQDVRPNRRIPGCYGLKKNGVDFQAAWRLRRDGDPRGTRLVTTSGGRPIIGPTGFRLFDDPGVHPFTGQKWQNEMAAVSWNFQMLLVSQSGQWNDPLERMADNGRSQQEIINRAYGLSKDGSRLLDAKCGFLQPQFCGTPEAILGVIGVTRSTVAANGNGSYGRRTFTWHAGGEVVLEYDKRNVLGFSADWAEDITKSNWSIEATWFNDVTFGDAEQFDGASNSDTYQLTISVDRPTFINFLNANRTFFFNTQWFIQYIDDFKDSYSANGPWNFLGTFSVGTGYFQDRLLPSVTFVYDVRSVSAASLPQITYRYNEAFSITFGAALFLGRTQDKDLGVNPAGGVSNRQGKRRDQVGVEAGLAPLRDRDEIYLRLRYTF